MSVYKGRRTVGSIRQEREYLRNNPWARSDGGFIVNAGIAREAYFRGSNGGAADSIWRLLKVETESNHPAEQAITSRLWDGVSASKGMFVVSEINSPTYTDPRGAAYQPGIQDKYGFQFHYNPTTVQMAYAGNPDFDVTMFTSGKDKFNLLGSAATQSTISFNIVLNRLHDMKYFTGQGIFKSNVTKSQWAGKFPTAKEQQDIWNKGTMYDIEYFLRTVMQVKQPVAFSKRNSFDGKTADLGFLTGIPVDLHLGNAMRYWVRLDALGINHVIFNERMVPLFSEVSVTCSRIPDYASDAA